MEDGQEHPQHRLLQIVFFEVFFCKLNSFARWHIVHIQVLYEGLATLSNFNLNVVKVNFDHVEVRLVLRVEFGLFFFQ